MSADDSPTPPAPDPQPTARWAGMDLMRMVAAVAIVWLHATEGLATVVGRFAVPFFAASIGMLVVAQKLRRPEMRLPKFAHKRAVRLLVPFYLWTVIYATVRWMGGGFTPYVHPEQASWDLLWNGSAHHLWFLPFAFVLSLVAFVAASAATRAPKTLAIGLAFAAAVCLLTPNPAPVERAWYCVRLGLAALPAGIAGMALGVAWSCPGVWRPPARWATLGVTVVCLVAMVTMGRTRFVALENVAGFAALLACLSETAPPWGAALIRWPALPYGVYLCHVLFLEGLQDLARMAGFDTTMPADAVIFLGATALSIGSCLLAIRLRLGWMIGG